MPKIQFADLPRGVWNHLLQRVDERRISVGDWYKDFGSFLLCGSGKFPKTVLEKGMKPFGDEIA